MKIKVMVELEISNVKENVETNKEIKSIVETGIKMSDFFTENWAEEDPLRIDKVSVTA